MDERDPVQQRSEGTLDLHDVTDWEARSALDRLSLRLYQGIKWGLQAMLVVLAVLILLGQFALGGLGAVTNPDIGVFVALSAVPAFGLAAYIWYADVTTPEPLVLLVGTFVLGVLFAGFAGVLNVELSAVLDALGIGVIGFYFLVVGPVEESVKLLAVRLYAYRSARFDAVIDGAVYGAVAGLGFATIENAYYITSNIDTVSAGAITSVRALAGPGHVIYSAFAGYYLGLAKFNREHAGPIVLKGLLIAAFIHGLYNVLSEFLPTALAAVLGVNWFFGFVLYVLLFDGVFGLVLLRKLQAYRRAYDIVHRRRAQPSPPSE
jgi:RsiW-degrading membrane proteinase PrsW (M82 family)